MSYTMAQANALLANINSETDQLSVAASGAQPRTTRQPYSGWVGDGVHTGVVAEAIAAALNSGRQYGQHQQEKYTMTFVNEHIPETEKEKFTFPVFTRPDGSKPTLSWWTIDRERNAFLVITNILGGGYEGTPETHYYVLSWNGNLIRFAGDPQTSGSMETGQVMSWRLHHLVIPPALQNSQKEVLQLIREALDAKDWPYRRSSFVTLNIEFDLSSSH